MKNITIFFTAIYMLSSTLLFSQNLLKQYYPSIDTYNKIITNVNNINIDQIQKNIIFYELNTETLNSIMDNDIHFLDCSIPFFNSNVIHINMELYKNNTIQLKRHTQNGLVHEQYAPRIKTYKIQNKESDIEGVFIFSKDGVKSVFTINDVTYQIDMLHQTNNDHSIYFVLDTNNSLIDFNFLCGHDFIDEAPDYLDYSNYKLGDVFGCIDIAMEIDYYTFQTFNNYQDAIDWALEMIVVAQVIYLEELELNLVSSSAQIWETEDPYLEFINDPQSMLIAIRENWTNNEDFTDIDRHLVHLFSKRNNTGTGGIAFLNGVGSDWSGYGFSSNLVDVEEYVDLPVPYFFWNIYCLVHELGHNFGAKHTQWCGWPGGPIDNCSNIEELIPGECEDYINNPTPQVGTIMSYCHTWPFQSGGGINMKFHDYVKQSIIPYLGLQDLYECENIEQVFGCIDINACNYDALANTDNSSCIYPELNLDCNGNCLNDENENNICDEDELLFVDNEIIDYGLSLFPNPAYNFINVKVDNLLTTYPSVKLYNSLGQLVFNSNYIENNSKIDVSSISSGVYSAHIIDGNHIIEQTIIIQ